jgi:hypothetical protein
MLNNGIREICGSTKINKGLMSLGPGQLWLSKVLYSTVTKKNNSRAINQFTDSSKKHLRLKKTGLWIRIQ